MDVVLDTNILISAQVFGGKPRETFELIVYQKYINGFTSEWLLQEYLRVLRQKFHYQKSILKRAEDRIRKSFSVLEPITIPKLIAQDPDDNHVLAIVDSHSINYIISGDSHLLKLKQYHKVPIITPDKFLSSL